MGKKDGNRAGENGLGLAAEMSGFSAGITHNSLKPAIGRLQGVCRHPAAAWRAGGNVLLSVTVGNFNSVGAALRPTPWKEKADGSPSNLKATGQLVHSFRLSADATSATVSTDWHGATIRGGPAIHQFGGVIKPKNAAVLRFQSGGRWWTVKSATMPARPFFPISPDGRLTPAAAELVVRAIGRAVARHVSGQFPPFLTR